MVQAGKQNGRYYDDRSNNDCNVSLPSAGRTGRYIPVFRQNMLPPSSEVKMLAVCTSETLVYALIQTVLEVRRPTRKSSVP